MDRPIRVGRFRLLLIVFLGAVDLDCGTWRTTRVDEDRGAIAAGDTLRLRRGDVSRTVRVVRLQYPLIEAVEDAPAGPQAVVLDLTTFDEIEVYDYPRGVGLTSLAVVGVLAGIAALAGGVALLVCSANRCFGD